MSSTPTPDGNSDPFDGIQDDSGRRHSRGVDPTLRESRSSGIDPTIRESGVSGSGSGHEWTGLGSWRIRGELGSGGEAELFVVGRDGGEVAILKAYVFEDGEAKQQPVMPDPEVLDAIRDLACPGLVQTLEHGIAAEGGCLAGRYCEVMEDCEGQIQTQDWDDEAELLALVGQMAKALQALHSRRIAHRDVKPANILIGGMTERVYKLGDYGIATFANRRSRMGRRDASPMYASPAQLSGLVSMTDDWWSLGMIVQESLMGRHPHAGKSPEDIQHSYVTQEFRPQVPRMVSDRWKPLLEGLLDYDPEKRWSHEEVLRWCEGGLAGKPPVGEGGPVGETAGWLRRSWLFLEDGDFESVKEYAERVLDREPETGEAYWVKALAELGVRRESDLLEHKHKLSGNGDYQKALRFGAIELRRRLEGIEADIQGRIAEDRGTKKEELKRSGEEERRLAEEAQQRTAAEQIERERQIGLLAALREQLANGQLEAAIKLWGTVGKRSSDLRYSEVEKALNQAKDERSRLEAILREAVDGLNSVESGLDAALARFPIFPPVVNLRRCHTVRGQAAAAMAESVKYMECVSGTSGEAVRRLFEEVKGLDRGMTQKVLRLGRLVKALGVIWVIALATGGLIFQQHLGRQERERHRFAAEAKAAEERALAEAKVKAEAEEQKRQKLAVEAKAVEERAIAEAKAMAKAAEERALAEAKVKADAEEQKRQRLAAEAKAVEERAIARANADEAEFASKLGISRPFASGARGQAGVLPVRWIPAGQYRMGSPGGEKYRSRDEVQHDVVLTRGFLMAETECTQAQWEAVMGSNPSEFKGADRPVEQVSWEESVEYCRKLTAKQRAEGILPDGWEWRLPTEAEWEYAARAGTTEWQPGELDAIAWFGGNTSRGTRPVKLKAANAWGLHDMLGNVSEWCSDWYGDYPAWTVTDPTGPSSNFLKLHVFRGGDWLLIDRGVRWAKRSFSIPGIRGILGFRPVLCSVGVREPASVEADAMVELGRLEEMERRRLAAIPAQKTLQLKAEGEKATDPSIDQTKQWVESEAAIASKLGLSRPFAQGAHVQAGMIWVRWIPAGRFMMGSPSSETGRDLDEVVHEVVLSQGFFMAETECTQVQWELVMGSNPSNFKGPNRPVEGVSWAEAIEYCRKLTLKQRSEGLLPAGWEWRLPTESEGEYGARAGEKGLRHGELDAVAWWSGNSGFETHTVGGKQANAWGLYDMMGNVLEWCNDWHGEYPTGSVTDPRGPNSGSFRVRRGGSWNYGAGRARSALRDRLDQGGRNYFLGFRPALSSVR